MHTYPVLLNLILLAFLALAAIAARAFACAKRSSSTTRYALIGEVLSPAERSFKASLDIAIPPEFAVFPKVRLADVIRITPPSNIGAFNRISGKHLDFLIVTRPTSRPVLAVELDDRSHKAPSRRSRDEFVDSALRDAGLPIVRVSAALSYTPATLVEILGAHLTDSTSAR